MGIVEEGGKIGQAAIASMGSTPLAIALLIVNIGFLAFAGYVLGEVAQNAAERNKQQMDLIVKLVTDCRVAPNKTSWEITYPPSPLGPTVSDPP